MVKTEANSAKNTSAEYRKIQPLGKIPAFEGANGFNLSEVIAIAIYGTLMTTVLFGFFIFFSFAIQQFPAVRLSLHDEIYSYPCQNYSVEIIKF